jgi:hypothetical protein
LGIALRLLNGRACAGRDPLAPAAFDRADKRCSHDCVHDAMLVQSADRA